MMNLEQLACLHVCLRGGWNQMWRLDFWDDSVITNSYSYKRGNIVIVFPQMLIKSKD